MNLPIKSQRATPEKPEENAHSWKCAAPGAAVEHENDPLTTWLDACPVPTDDSSESATNRAEMLQSLAVALRASLPAEEYHRLAMLLEAPDDLLEAPDDLPTDRRG